MGSEHQYSKLNIICTNIENNRHCPHGPSLLYERIQINGSTQKFYACSAYKSRKDCSFFLPYVSGNFGEKLFHSKEMKNSLLPNGQSVKMLHQRLKKIKLLSSKERSYCHTCSYLLLPDEHSEHKSHDVHKNVSNFLLNHPSQLLHLQTNTKGESQYIFTKKSIEVIINALKELNISNVLCLGTPSVHEMIKEHESNHITSLFLDIDYRYNQFYDETEFCWFNMMNFYFFKNSGKNKIKQFLNNPNVVLIMDPPFSAREEPIAYTLSKFNSLLQCSDKNILPVIWIFPYFKENEVLKSWPGMVMLDYDVTYTNQKKFKGNNKTSVVRIFTNLDASKFKFPIEDGYHFCSDCKRWVSKFNNHCFKCGVCPSKNGHQYKHCDLCARCVKEYWHHCKRCGRCALKQHPCDLWLGGKGEFMTESRKGNEDILNCSTRKRKREVVINKKLSRLKRRKKYS